MLGLKHKERENSIEIKIIHPKVLRILHHLSEPSPVRLVKDLLQPITGSLAEKRVPLPMSSMGHEMKICKKQNVTLNLSLSSIRGKRLSICKDNR